MKYEELLRVVGDQPVFETGFLLAGTVEPGDVRSQLSRWVKAGRIYQLRRGLYALAPPFQKVKPHPFVISNRMLHGSYVSCQSALAHYGLIPEYTPVTVSVTTARPGKWSTPFGAFDFRHIKIDLFYGYERVELAQEQYAFVATPEKALLDLVYLQPHADSPDYLRELRLQNLERVNVERMLEYAQRSASPKLKRATDCIVALAQAEAADYETL